ncbi:hypothetical protein ACFSTH_18175 [Paenibacillus yanchengensis]|uniref:ATPase n=1 Tax=Paenibacillus yanchengensis TaxID=2035833 RepID=A0ABW4YPG4_9BACL
MSTSSNAIHYMATANTAGGLTNELASSLQEIDHVVELKGTMHQSISILLQLIATQMQSQSTCWFLHHPLQADLLDGIVFPELRTAILYSNPHDSSTAIDWSEKLLFSYHLDQACDQEKLLTHSKKTEQLAQQIISAKNEAYTLLATALRIHDDWEALYRPYIDFAKTNQVTEDYLHLLFANATPKTTTPRQVVRLLGTATAEGAVDFVPSITAGLQKYHLKGRAGSGKSTILRKVAAQANALGYDSEVYRCGLDSASIDMVIVRELNFAIFDSTPPHAYVPVAPDITIDLYELCMQPDADSQIAEPLEIITTQYKAMIKAATAKLEEAATYKRDLEAIYEQSCNYEAFNTQLHTILTDIHQSISNV